MSAAALTNQMRLQALMAAGALAAPKKGLVTSYDPNAYAVKVKLQPSDIETGWLPIVTMMAGQGWGVYFGPAIGDQAAVAFEEGSVEVGFCIGFLPSDEDKPPNVPSGQGLLQHKGGAFIKLAGGGVRISDLTVEGNLSVGTGASGSFTTPMGDTVTVQDGIITNIY